MPRTRKASPSRSRTPPGPGGGPYLSWHCSSQSGSSACWEGIHNPLPPKQPLRPFPGRPNPSDCLQSSGCDGIFKPGNKHFPPKCWSTAPGSSKSVLTWKQEILQRITFSGLDCQNGEGPSMTCVLTGQRLREHLAKQCWLLDDKRSIFKVKGDLLLSGWPSRSGISE